MRAGTTIDPNTVTSILSGRGFRTITARFQNAETRGGALDALFLARYHERIVFAFIRRIVSVALPILVLAAATSNAGSVRGIRGGAPAEPKVCDTIPTGPVTMTASQAPAWNDEPVCGGRANDTLRANSRGHDHRLPGRRHDLRGASPAVANEINGGPGTDRATVDEQDLGEPDGRRAVQAEREGQMAFLRLPHARIQPRHAAAAADSTIPSYEEYVQCRLVPGTTRAADHVPHGADRARRRRDGPSRLADRGVPGEPVQVDGCRPGDGHPRRQRLDVREREALALGPDG